MNRTEDGKDASNTLRTSELRLTDPLPHKAHTRAPYRRCPGPSITRVAATTPSTQRTRVMPHRVVLHKRLAAETAPAS